MKWNFSTNSYSSFPVESSQKYKEKKGHKVNVFSHEIYKQSTNFTICLELQREAFACKMEYI